MAVSKPLLTEFVIHHRLESCGYRLNRLDEPIFMAVSKPLRTELGIHKGLESCGMYHYQWKEAVRWEVSLT